MPNGFWTKTTVHSEWRKGGFCRACLAADVGRDWNASVYKSDTIYLHTEPFAVFYADRPMLAAPAAYASMRSSSSCTLYHSPEPVRQTQKLHNFSPKLFVPNPKPLFSAANVLRTRPVGSSVVARIGLEGFPAKMVELKYLVFGFRV